VTATRRSGGVLSWVQLRVNGTRGAALLVGAVLCFTRCLAYLPIGDPIPDRLPGGLSLISSVISIEVWAVAWGIIGVLCVVFAFRTRDAAAYGALVGIWAAWGVAYLSGWLISIFVGEPSREWLNATTYLCPALIVALLSARVPGRAREQ